MEKFVVLLGVYLVASLALAKLVWSVVKRWQEAGKKLKDMGRLKAGSVWRLRPKIGRNNPFAEDARHLVMVKDTRVNSDGRMWVRYLYKSGLEDTAPADMFVQMFIYVEDQDLGIKGDEVQRMARGMVRIAKQGNGNKNI